MKHITILFTLLFVVCSCCSDDRTPSLQDGDLLFCYTPSGNAITDVTQGAEGLQIDHVGIFYKSHVIEAVRWKGVTITPLDSFLKDNHNYVVAAKVENANTKKSIQRALLFVGLPYDSLFLPDDRAIYCSELVQKSYVNDDDSLVFEPIPMSFHDKNGEITPYWKNFYRRHNMDVPEGRPGSNPGDLSRRKNVVIYRRLCPALTHHRGV